MTIGSLTGEPGYHLPLDAGHVDQLIALERTVRAASRKVEAMPRGPAKDRKRAKMLRRAEGAVYGIVARAARNCPDLAGLDDGQRRALVALFAAQATGKLLLACGAIEGFSVALEEFGRPTRGAD